MHKSRASFHSFSSLKLDLTIFIISFLSKSTIKIWLIRQYSLLIFLLCFTAFFPLILWALVLGSQPEGNNFNFSCLLFCIHSWATTTMLIISLCNNENSHSTCLPFSHTHLSSRTPSPTKIFLSQMCSVFIPSTWENETIIHWIIVAVQLPSHAWLFCDCIDYSPPTLLCLAFLRQEYWAMEVAIPPFRLSPTHGLNPLLPSRWILYRWATWGNCLLFTR